MRADRPYCLSSALTILLLTFAHASRGDESQQPRTAGESIQLPSGTVVKVASFEAHPKWRECFPPGHPFFAEKYAEGGLRGMHSRYMGRLDGASVVLHENGALNTLMYYPDGQREGACRVWDDDNRMVLYAQFKNNKKHGVTCLFKDRVPWLVQQWKAGSLENETIVARKGNDFAAVEDAQQLAQAQGRLAAVEKELAEDESELKDNVRSWYVDEKNRVEAEKEKAVRPVQFAKLKAAGQAQRLGKDNRKAAAHPDSRRGRVAEADAEMARKSLKAAQNSANAKAKAATNKLRALRATLAAESKEMYAFALKSLETATGKRE